MPPRAASSSKRATKKTTEQEQEEARKERIEVEERASLVATRSVADTPFVFTPEKDQFNGEYEFGGWLGSIVIMLGSHFIMYYVYVVIHNWDGEMLYPYHPRLGGESFLLALKRHVLAGCIPSFNAFAIYIGFLAIQWLFAVIMPGPVAHGKAVPSEGGFMHRYKCNAVSAWWTLLALVVVLWKFDVWRLSDVARHYGEYLSASIIVADIVSVLVYVQAIVQKRMVRMSGNLVYDFFMGASLNPKLPLGVDFKMLAELRISWGYLFLVTLGHTFYMYETTGTVTNSMWLLLLGHFLYCNACHKGEECVPMCWDIFHEKFGWMLIFWNMAGVPVFYGVQAMFLVKIRGTYQMPLPLCAAILVVLLVAYYVFDTANGQKNRFRMMRDGASDELLYRRAFPVLPWGHIQEPETLKGKGKLKGKEIFVDGLLRYARKINYTSDNVIAWCWGASCGFGYFLPFFYATFHICMLLHRCARDEQLMAGRYGALWDEYVKKVPYRFIPFVY